MEQRAHGAATQRPRLVLATGNFFFRYRNLVFPLVFLPFLVLIEPRPLGGSWRTDAWLDALGLAVVALGQGLRVLVIGLAYIHRGGKKGRVHADELVTEGVFAHSRNPLYLGNLLVIGGLLLVFGDPAVAVVLGAFFLLAYLSITAAEENFLEGRFGQPYRDYCERVPRFLPRLAGLSTTVRAMRFDWRKVVRKEYGTLYATLTICLLLVGRECALAAGGVRGSHGLAALVSIWLVATALYVLARVLKKSRLLHSAESGSEGS